MSRGGTSIPDDEWERFLRESEAGSPGAPEEPSARARMVTRRLQEEPGRPEAWRTYVPARRRGKGWYVFGLAVAVVLLIAVFAAPGRIPGLSDGDGTADATPLAAESERPDGPPAAGGSDQEPTPAEPFRGSPAERWSDGAAGIHLPQARATGWMSEAEVARALERTRDFLVASSLDSAVLSGEKPEKAIALINPHQADVRAYLEKAFTAPDRENDPLLLFSRFRSAEVRPVGDVVRTRGRISFREGEKGAVRVSADVTYVYPVRRASGNDDEVARVIVRRETVVNWDDPEKIVTEPGTFSIVSYKLDTTNGGCDVHDGYLHPAFRADRSGAASDDGRSVDPYDRSGPIEDRQREDGRCDTATRS
ncbi:hypothetical protein [Streptomyces californicus]|uniref:hypothetical protein n=1 Tax=Streptomyces californicus TaxID=67351 RepID=UPI001E47DFCD|nr:hypothetical protein [Streptomyces californicus]MCC0576462.1 hypothetical protein [Streptomyces californicus]